MPDRAEKLRELMAGVETAEKHEPKSTSKIDYERLWKWLKTELGREAAILFDDPEEDPLDIERHNGRFLPATRKSVTEEFLERMEQAETLAMTREVRV